MFLVVGGGGGTEQNCFLVIPKGSAQTLITRAHGLGENTRLSALTGPTPYPSSRQKPGLALAYGLLRSRWFAFPKPLARFWQAHGDLSM